MTDTSIEWCRRPGTRAMTWNPTNGCEECSPGCLHCYAKTFAARFSGPGMRYEGLVERRGKRRLPMWTGELRVETHKLADPLSWRDPCTVFVNSMSDLFMFPPEVIAAVFAMMAAAKDHTFIILTKRAEEMPRWFEWLDDSIEEAAAEWSGRDCATSIDKARNGERMLALIDHAANALGGTSEEERERWTARLYDLIGDDMQWPLPNVWLGVTAEDCEHGLPRLDHLRRTPAAVRLVSFEPLLENLGEVDLSEIDWAIVGCESGHGARPFDVAWLRELRRQCAAARVAFFIKQAPLDEPCAVCHGRGVIRQRKPPATYACSSCSGRMGTGVVTAGPGSQYKGGGVVGAPCVDGEQCLEYPTPRAA